jgi:hypothetical protein
MISALLVSAKQSIGIGSASSSLMVAASFYLMWRKVVGAMAIIALSALAGCVVHGVSLLL